MPKRKTNVRLVGVHVKKEKAAARDAGAAAEAERLFTALGDGGQVHMPLGETFFSPRFGMVADKFGVSWMIVTMPAEAKAAAAE